MAESNTAAGVSGDISGWAPAFAGGERGGSALPAAESREVMLGGHRFVVPDTVDTVYDLMLFALGEARRLDEISAIRNVTDQLLFAARQAQDTEAQANLTEVKMRAERRLGETLIEVKAAGLLDRGGNRPAPTGSRREQAEQVGRVSLKELGISRKLSAKAQALAGSPLALFEDVVRRTREEIVAGKARPINVLRDVVARQKALRRQAREMELSKKAQALPTGLNCGVIVADPAWNDPEVFSSETGMDRAAENHYPTMSLEEIMDLDVDALAAPDAVLFLWCKANNIDAAFCVAQAWGFWRTTTDAKGRMIPDRSGSGARFASDIVWDKVEIGTGRWVRDRHEMLLIFRRGKPVAPAMGAQLESVLRERKGAHSEKPELVLEWIDATWPTTRKIELNRRGAPREGWLAWGNEVEQNSLETADDLPAASGTDRELSVAGSWDALGRQSADTLRAERGRPGEGVTAGETAHALASAPAALGPRVKPEDDGGESGEGILGGLPVAAAESTAEETGREPRARPAVTGGESAAFRSTPETDAVIRRHYAGGSVDFAALCAELGCTKLQARRRANQLGLGNRDRQAAAVAQLGRDDSGKFLTGAGA